VSVRLYVDVHVPGAVTRGLLLRNVDVLTAQLDGAAELDDSALLDRARQLNRVLVSQDEHLLAEAARRQREGIPFSGVIYAHQLSITIGRFIDDLELIASVGEPDDLNGRIEFLPL
jgi:predicted nuclease of predicted toxin-antitoxin system